MPRKIKITPVLNGFVCEIECTLVVVTSLNALCEGIREYYTDPEGTEKRWLSNGINRQSGGQGEGPRLVARDQQCEVMGQVAACPSPAGQPSR